MMENDGKCIQANNATVPTHSKEIVNFLVQQQQMRLMINATTIWVFMLMLPQATSFLSSPGGEGRLLSHKGQSAANCIRPLAMFKKPFNSIVNLLDKKEPEKNENKNSGKNGSLEQSDLIMSSRELLSTTGSKGVVNSLTNSAKNSEPPSQSTMASSDISNNKFDFVQRIESVKCAVIGAISGSLAVAPVAFIHHITTSLPQWELTTDMAAVQGALFAIVYRYAIRNDDNPMLNQGVLGAFVLVRTLPTIQASPDCTALPLQCGAPIGYFNWSMLNQAIVQGIESAVLFGGAYLALDYAFSKGWISKFE